MAEGDCTLWHTTYRWRDLKRDRRPRRPEPMHVSTRCIAGKSTTAKPKPAAAEKTIKIDVDNHGGSPASDALENFDMDREGPNTAFYRGQDGERVEMKNVDRIQFYDNVVIIRLRDGTGRLVPVAEFLGLAW